MDNTVRKQLDELTVKREIVGLRFNLEFQRLVHGWEVAKSRMSLITALGSALAGKTCVTIVPDLKGVLMPEQLPPCTLRTFPNRRLITQDLPGLGVLEIGFEFMIFKPGTKLSLASIPHSRP